MSSLKPARFHWVRWALAGVAVLVAGFLFGLRRPGGLERRLAAIRAQGYPITLEELGNPLGTNTAAARRNAAALAGLGLKLRVDTKRNLPARGTNTAEDVAWARTQLAGDNAAVFAELHAQLAGGPWCFSDYSRGPMNASFSYLGDVKGLANALQVEAVSAALTGDTNRAAAAVLAGLRVGRTLENGGVLIDYLVRVAADAIAARSAETVFTKVQLTETQLAALQSAFRRAEGTNALRLALIGERAYGLVASRTNPGQLAAAMNPGPGGPPAGGAPSPISVMFGSLYAIFLQPGDLLYYLDQMERLIAITVLSGPAAQSAQEQLQADFYSAGGKWRRPLSRMTLPALFKAVEKEWRHVAVQRCARAGCAVERFRGAHGRLPATLDELVPAFLEAVPPDPMTGQPLKYRRLDRGYVVYSVGEDSTDDGGAERVSGGKGGAPGWDYTFTVER